MKELKGIKLVVGYLILGFMILIGTIGLVTLSPFLLAFWVGDKIKNLTAFVWIYLSDSAHFASEHFWNIACNIYGYFDKPDN